MKILGKPSATLDQCQTWIDGVKTAHPMAKAMVPLLWDAAIVNGIDPTVLIAQAMKETGYFNFKGVIRPNFCNTCGLKVTKGGGDQDPGAHMRFDYWEDGIMAHSDHLALYAGASNQPKYSPECGSHQNEQYRHNGTTKDPRHFTYLHGKCPNVEDLSGNWAPGSDYGQEVIRIANQMINTIVEERTCSNPEDSNYKELYEKTKSNLESVMHSMQELKSALEDKDKLLCDKDIIINKISNANRELERIYEKTEMFKSVVKDFFE